MGKWENNGTHEKMIIWKSLEELRIIMKKILMCVPKTEFKTLSQITSAHDSMASNFVEGYYSGYKKEYLRFISYSRRSGAELFERVRRIHKLDYIGNNIFKEFEERCTKTNYLFDRLKFSLQNKKT